jgi:carbonic anhydrase
MPELTPPSARGKPAGTVDLRRRRGAGTALSGCTGSAEPAAPAATAATAAAADNSPVLALSAPDAVSRLRAGNARFVAGRSQHPDQTAARRTEVAGGQHPFAQVLACADSRVAPELVFDQGLGDLFVTRSAGQVLDKAVLGTIEFGVAEFGIPLLLVLGHSRCGAVKATMEALEKHSGASGTDVDALVAAIKPAVETVENIHPTDLLAAAVSQNVANVVEQLRSTVVLAPAVRAGKLQVVGAVYDLTAGTVTFS